MSEVNTLWMFEGDSSEAVASVDEMIASLDALDASVQSAAAGAADIDVLGESMASAAMGGTSLDDTVAALVASLSALTDSVTAAAGSVDTMGANATAASGQLDAMAGSADAAAGSLDAVAGSAGGAAVATDAAAASSGSLTKGLNMLKGPLLIAGLAVAAVGVASVVMAGNFQSSMIQLVTGAGESQSNLQLVTNGILAMAPAVGESTGQLAKGMYMIESGGFHGAAGLAILQAAAEGAKVGNADLGVVADATDTILKNFGQTGLTASGAVNTLIATVANGKTHMTDLATALAQVLPTGAAAGVGINDVMAAMATMTSIGVPAANAATYLRQTIIALSAPSKGAQKAMESFGLSASQVATEMHTSLPGALKEITDAIGKKFPEGSAGYIAAIKTISGGSKQMQGMLDLTGTHMKTFQGDVGKISGATKEGGKSIVGWSAVQGTFNQTMDKLGATLEVAAIQVGDKLLPSLTRLASYLAGHLPGAINSTIQAVTYVSTHFKTFAPIAAVLAGVIGGVLVFALYSMAVAAWTALAPVLVAAAPFIAVGLAIGVVVGIIVLLVTHWGAISKFFENIWHAITGFVGRVWGAITGFFGRVVAAIAHTVADWEARFHVGVARIQSVIRAGFTYLVNLVEAPFKAIVGLFGWLYNHNYYFKALVDFIHKEFERARVGIQIIWHAITGWLAGAWNAIKATAQNAWKQVQEHIITPIRRAVALVEERINYAKALLAAAWLIVTTDVSTAWNKFTSVISSAVATVKTDIGNVISAIMTPIDNLAQTLYNAGVKMIQMLINGIKSMGGAVVSAAQGVASGIMKNLGFHSPTEEGPGATADRWMPALGAMLERDLLAQTSRVQAAASKVAGAIATGIHSPTGGAGAIGVGGGGAAGGGLPAGLTSSLGGGAGGVGGGMQAQLLQRIASLLEGGNRAPQLGSTAPSAALGSVTQNFSGGMNFNGVSNVNELYNILNALGGVAQENGLRGATLGLGL